MRLLHAALVAVVSTLFLPGCCLMLGNYQTARTPEKGTSEVGMTVGITTYQFETEIQDDPGTPENEARTETSNIPFPVLIPEIPFGVAVTDDVTIGGRIAPMSLGIEGNMKWRFLHADRLHMAIVPAIHYQAFFFLTGYGARLPLLVTYDVSDNFSFTTAIQGSVTNWILADEDFDEDEDDEELLNFDGQLASFGMSAGVEIRGESFFVRPSLEFTRYQSKFGAEEDDVFEPFNSYGVVLSIGFVIGRVKKQLDRMERKIDELGGKPSPSPNPNPFAPNDSSALLLPKEREPGDLLFD